MQKYYELIGEVSSNFNLLEMTIKGFVASLINEQDHYKGFLVINDYQYSKLVTTFKMLFEHSIKDKKALKAFSKVYKRCADINIKRNNILHSAYVEYDDGKERKKVLRLSLKLRKGGLDSTNISLKELEEFRTEMLKCYHNICTIRYYLRVNKILVVDEELDEDIDTYNIDKLI